MGFPINERLTEGLAFPVIAGYYGTLTTAQVSAAVDLQKARKVAFLVQGFTLGTAATVTANATAGAAPLNTTCAPGRAFSLRAKGCVRTTGVLGVLRRVPCPFSSCPWSA
jgi:hypothetical protein